jgi:hypothetical protein
LLIKPAGVALTLAAILPKGATVAQQGFLIPRNTLAILQTALPLAAEGFWGVAETHWYD